MIRAFLASLFIFIGFSVSAATTDDITAIKSMAGCYNVDFNFIETSTAANYPITSKPYKAQGTEYVTVDFESPTEIHLQHILVGDGWIQKHWRDEWKLKPQTKTSYVDTLTWMQVPVVAKDNEWVEQVLSVDDSPRYGCVSSWDYKVHKEGTWNCTAWAPLPRREYEVRKDYNILNRGSHIVIAKNGWSMIEDNEKIIEKNNQAKVIAKEEGSNVYGSLDASKCATAAKYWNDNKKIWHVIQATQKEIYAQHPVLKLRPTERNHFLWQELFYLADQYSQKSTYTDDQLKKDTITILNKFIL